MTRLVPASPEVLKHHADQHPCADGKADARLCPCGQSVAICCTACGDVVFIAVAPDGPPCAHVREFTSARGDRP